MYSWLSLSSCVIIIITNSCHYLVYDIIMIKKDLSIALTFKKLKERQRGAAVETLQVAAQDAIKEKQVPPEKIFLYGHSLGGAIAIELGRQHPEVAGLIVEGCFTSIRDFQIHVPGAVSINHF